jgi:hypothetical protein
MVSVIIVVSIRPPWRGVKHRGSIPRWTALAPGDRGRFIDMLEETEF